MKAPVFQMPTVLKSSAVKEIKMSTVDIDVKQAQQWLAKNFDRQRGITSAHAALMAIAMKNGEFFRLDPLKFARVGPNGAWHLMDGQHTLTAIVRSGITLVSQRVVRVEVPTVPALGSLYAKIDTHKGRTPTQRLKALGLHDIAKQVGVPIPVANKTAIAASMIYRNFKIKGHKLPDPEDIFPYAVHYLGAAHKIVNLLEDDLTASQEALYEILKNKGPWAVLLVIMDEQEVKATKYLEELFAMANLGRKALKKQLDAGKPTAQLYQMLIAEQDGLLCRKVQRFDKFRVAMDQSYRYCIVVAHYWEKFYSGKTTVKFRLPTDAIIAVPIAGTRWTQNSDKKVIVDPVKCIDIKGYLKLP